MIKNRSQSWFTLLEVLLTVTLMGILGAISIGIYFSYKSSTDLELTSQTLAQMLRRAQTLARSGAHESDWGVSVQDDQADCTGLVDLESILVDDYLAAIPADPTTADAEGTGYFISQNNGRVSVCADAETAGTTISVTR